MHYCKRLFSAYTVKTLTNKSKEKNSHFIALFKCQIHLQKSCICKQVNNADWRNLSSHNTYNMITLQFVGNRNKKLFDEFPNE